MDRSKFGFMSGRTFNIVISIIIAVLLWAYVIAEVNPVTQQTMVGIPVQLYNTDNITERELAISGNQNYTVDVVLEGKRRDIVKITASDVIATADLLGFGIGTNSVSVGVAVPGGMTIVEIRPAKIDVPIENLITATKPVNLKFEGSAAEGFELGAIESNPKEMEVTGAESEVNSVKSVQAVINIGDMDTTDKIIQVKAEPIDASGDPVANVGTSVGNIQVSGRIMSTKEVDLVVEITGSLDPLYEVKYINVPNTITIKGDADILAGITVIQAEPIDISPLKITKKIPVKPIFPAGVEAASGSKDIKAEIAIQAMATKDFTYTGNEIEIRGLDANLSAAVKADLITVKVSASQEIIDGLIKTDITPYVDLAGSTAGVGNVTVGLDSIKQVDVMVSEPSVVYVIITAN